MLAYIPDVLINTEKLKTITLSDYAHQYSEEYSLVYKPSTADGWLNRLVNKLQPI